MAGTQTKLPFLADMRIPNLRLLDRPVQPLCENLNHTNNALRYITHTVILSP
jgi:hypothetical protein